MPSSLIGALGLGRQSAKDVVSSTVQYLPTTSIGLNMAQNAQTLPPEIGGDYFLRGAYKASVMGSGDVAFVVRPNTIGLFLYMLAGQDSVSGVPGQTGAFQHIFTPFTPAVGVDLPWFTAYKDVTKLYGEQYLNTKLGAFSLDIPKSSIATATASLVSTTPSSLAIAGLPTETFDSTPAFQATSATVTIAAESPSPALTFPTKVERYSMSYNNNISQDEFSVGNLFLDNITLLQRTVQVSMDIVVRDTVFYQAVYLNGGTIPNAWSPAIYRGALTVTLNSTSNIPSTTQPYQLALTFPGLDFLMMPVNEAGADLVRATISTQVTLGPSGSDRFTATLINGIASY